MLMKDEELRIRLQAHKEYLTHPKLREDIPSLLSGRRSVKDTLRAVTAMQGIKLVRVFNDASTINAVYVDIHIDILVRIMKL